MNKEFKSLAAQAVIAEAMCSAEQGPQGETDCETPRFHTFLGHREISHIYCSVAYHFSSCPCAQEKNVLKKKSLEIIAENYLDTDIHVSIHMYINM